MTDLDLPALKKLCEAATPDWRLHEGFNRFEVNPGCYGLYLEFGNDGCVLVSMFRKNVELAVAARTALPQLIEEVERFRTADNTIMEIARSVAQEHKKENTALKAEVEKLKSHIKIIDGALLERDRLCIDYRLQNQALRKNQAKSKRISNDDWEGGIGRPLGGGNE